MHPAPTRHPLTALALGLLLAVGASTPAVRAADDWRTPAEASGFRQTPRYAETMAYFERLDAASPQIVVQAFGRSAQGRALNAVIVSTEGVATPEAARATGKPVVLIQAAIHPGENEGKDVLMALARDLTVSGKHADLVDAAVLVLVPIFNVDGHERFSPYNRINQNGPEAMGFRGTANNLNLNRDYTKADSPEMRAWLRLWQAWTPDLLIDLHNTNGADYQYAMTWAFETGPNIEPVLADWNRRAFDGVVKPAMARAGWPIAFYVSLKDGTDLAKGLVEGASGPRFSVGYAAAANRPGLLVETHMLKDFRTRVRVNEALLVDVLRMLESEGAALKAANAAADARRFAEGESIPLAFGLSDRTETIDFLGVDYTRTPSEVSGGLWVRYDPSKPRTFRLPVQRDVTVTADAESPAAWVVPPQWTDVIDRLALHGLRTIRLDTAREVEAGRWRFANPAWATRPFEGRLAITALEQTLERGPATLPAGSVIVPADQPRARLAALLLEPASPDSFLRWGFLNAVFEEKEYAEPRVMEAMARDMLARDPALRAEFEKRLEDPAFAGSAAQRLRFFYQRTPYFDTEASRDAVYRLDAKGLQAIGGEAGTPKG
ncbi:MAG: M14 family metallopeptidase [Lysobacteraceae bacterium]|jgi:murein tripeptide amidase MpaA|nr:M14 family metallopeptidase [Silanimonas sp.]